MLQSATWTIFSTNGAPSLPVFAYWNARKCYAEPLLGPKAMGGSRSDVGDSPCLRLKTTTTLLRDGAVEKYAAAQLLRSLKNVFGEVSVVCARPVVILGSQ